MAQTALAANGDPWYLDYTLTEPTRREDLFIEVDHVYKTLAFALAVNRPVSVSWMAVEFDESVGRDVIVGREGHGLAVMDLVGTSDSQPLGWAYLLSPHLEAAFTLSLDVVTDIHIEA